jgi:SAM-dependent methyltransferase
MGIARGAVKSLMQEGLRKPFTGMVLTLGRQDIYFSHDELQSMATAAAFPLRTPARVELSRTPDLRIQGFLSDRTLFECLGFTDSAAVDASDFESADHVFDLNRPDLPEELAERFDVIIDGGTLEHVFHVPNALRNIHGMLRPGGRIIHHAPSSNHMDHGFYMFSPTLFWDYYEANRYDVNLVQVFRYQLPAHNPWYASNYTPGCLDAIASGGLDAAMYGIICIATKTAVSTCDAIPQQRMYRDKWQADRESVAAGTSLVQKVSAAVKRYPRVHRLLYSLYLRARRKGLGLHVDAKY